MRRIAVLLLALASFSTSASAQNVEVGTGLICDTAEQVEEVAKLSNEGVGNQVAVEQVNARAASNACGVLAVAYIKGEKGATIRTKNGNAAIYQVLVVAVNLGAGWIQGQPLLQYTLFLTKEEDA